MHPNLNILPLGRMVIAAHPIDNDHCTLHSSTGSTVSVLPRPKIQQLYTIHYSNRIAPNYRLKKRSMHSLPGLWLSASPANPDSETPSLRGTCPLRCSAPPTPYTLTHSTLHLPNPSGVRSVNFVHRYTTRNNYRRPATENIRIIRYRSGF